jgi:hypothetical protein
VTEPALPLAANFTRISVGFFCAWRPMVAEEEFS